MLARMLIRDVMTESVVTAGTASSVGEVARLMRRRSSPDRRTWTSSRLRA
jgi:hypothetical protein